MTLHPASCHSPVETATFRLNQPQIKLLPCSSKLALLSCHVFVAQQKNAAFWFQETFSFFCTIASIRKPTCSLWNAGFLVAFWECLDPPVGWPGCKPEKMDVYLQILVFSSILRRGMYVYNYTYIYIYVLCVAPPMSNRGKWRSIGMPYWKCNKSFGHCSWEGPHPIYLHTYIDIYIYTEIFVYTYTIDPSENHWDICISLHVFHKCPPKKKRPKTPQGGSPLIFGLPVLYHFETLQTWAAKRVSDSRISSSSTRIFCTWRKSYRMFSLWRFTLHPENPCPEIGDFSRAITRERERESGYGFSFFLENFPILHPNDQQHNNRKGFVWQWKFSTEMFNLHVFPNLVEWKLPIWPFCWTTDSFLVGARSSFRPFRRGKCGAPVLEMSPAEWDTQGW